MSVSYYRLGEGPYATLPESLAEVKRVLLAKPSISTSLFHRLVQEASTILGLSIETTCDLLSQAYGYETHADLREQTGVAVRQGKKLRGPRPNHTQKDWDIRRSLLERGTLGESFEWHTVFFGEDRTYLLAIETLMVEHSDELLRAAVARYPIKITKETFDRTFGYFWMKVCKAHETGQYDFSVVGFMHLRRFARAVYCWYLRRYVTPTLVSVTAKRLDADYRRTSHRAYFPELETPKEHPHARAIS